MMKKKKNQKFRKNGISFIESTVATFIVLIGMIAVIELMTGSLRESMDSRDQTVAVLLAQEGVEIVRSIRDNNWADGKTAFEDNFPAADSEDCRVSFDTDNLESNGNSGCGSGTKVLNLRNSNFYSHQAGGTATKFQRRITIDFSNTRDNAKVTSLVTWKTGDVPMDPNNCNAANKCVYVQITLSDWGK